MDASKTSILGLLSSQNRQFAIPVYQRTYTWNNIHCAQLFNDILNVMNHTNKNHFIGSVVQISNKHGMISKVNVATIIDGQQRITTVSLLLLAMKHYIEENGGEVDSITSEEIADYLVNSKKKGEEYIKMQLTRRDKETYEALIHNKKIDEQPESNNIINNYNYFYKQLVSQQLNISNLYDGLAKLDVVEIALEREVDDPQLIFESLNSTGEKLTDADLIRNFLLMELDADYQKNIYENYWFPIEERLENTGTKGLTYFIRDYLTFKNIKIPRQDDVYEDFKLYFAKHYSRSHTDIENLIKDLDKYSVFYKKIISQTEKDPDINAKLESLNSIDVKVIYPFLLKLYGHYNEEKLNKNEFLRILNLIESYLTRKIVLGQGTQGLNKVFVTFIRDYDENQPVLSFEKAVLTKKGHHRFPNDEEFKIAFIAKDVYNLSSKYKKHLLYTLEHSLSNEKLQIDKGITIEHILPQNIENNEEWKTELGDSWKAVHNQYVHTIGNLTLTGYNSSMSNKKFKEKKEMLYGYNDSLINLNKGLKKCEHWGESQILERAEDLFSQALKIWEFPELQLDFNDSKLQLQQITLDSSWTNIKPDGFEFMSEYFSTKTFKDVYTSVIKKLYDFDKEAFYQAINQEALLNIKFHSILENKFEPFSYKVGNDIYINTNLSNDQKRKNLMLLFEFMEIDENDLIISIANSPE